MINPLAPLWSVYLNPIESNISPMISLFQKMKVNISPMMNLWKFVNMHTFNYSIIFSHEYPLWFIKTFPMIRFYQIQIKWISPLWLVFLKPIEIDIL